MTEKTSQKAKEIKGDLHIHTDNIFPIIKKWLYTDHEIFVRELVSNAFDAITKLQKINVHENLGLSITPKIEIKTDEKAKTITISDNGLGLDAEDVQKYINQIAFSGAEDFVKQYKDKYEKAQIIGHFGLGFYSSFMVADKVEIISRSYKKGAKAIHWECDGSTTFSIKEAERSDVGTDIILSISKESKDFLADIRIKNLVTKYANFLPVEITVNGETANDQNPLWIKQPNDCKDDDYKAFYKKLFPMDQDPLFWIHLNVDYPFNLKGILYFPKLSHELDTKGNIKLFCQQVFVSDNAKEVVPEFLTLLRGAIDCPDIPLNVSRSSLQNDPYVQKISKHIVKKISDKLTQLYKKDYENFTTYWSDISPFIKYGMMNHDDFYQKTKDVVIFKNSNDAYTTLDDYLERNKETLEKKVLYASNPEAQASYIQLCKDNGFEVLYLEHVIDTHFIQFLEMKQSEIKFQSVDSDLSDYLTKKISKDDETDDKSDSESDKKKKDDSPTALESLFKSLLNKDTLKVSSQALKSSDVSAIILESEQSKRIKQMSAMMKGFQMPGMEDYTLVVNTESPVIQRIQSLEGDDSKKDLKEMLCRQVYDLAVLSHKGFSGAEMTDFIKRSNALLSGLN